MFVMAAKVYTNSAVQMSKADEVRRYSRIPRLIAAAVFTHPENLSYHAINSHPLQRSNEFMFCLYLQHMPRSFFFSTAAQRIYRTAAVLSVLLFLVWAKLIVLGVSPASASLVRPLLFLGALPSAITLVGMWSYLLCFDDSHPLKQIVWFCLMAVPFLGAPLYCFAVYSRSMQRNPPMLSVAEVVKSR